LVQGVKALWRYPEIDPVAFALGPVTIYWYGLMYVAGFAGGLGLGLFRAKKSPLWNRDRVLDLLFYVAVGLVLGARIGYMLFMISTDLWLNPGNWSSCGAAVCRFMAG
jgi:phosphatidylglycerol---prolipoprotein diacylglyceryl transferase